jgi:hypothetical protein
MSEHESQRTHDHETIGRWAEERNGHPARVKVTCYPLAFFGYRKAPIVSKASTAFWSPWVNSATMKSCAISAGQIAKSPASRPYSQCLLIACRGPGRCPCTPLRR